MTVKEVAAYMEVHPNTVRNWCKLGEITFKKLGYRTIRISKEDIDTFIRKRTFKATHV